MGVGEKKTAHHRRNWMFDTAVMMNVEKKKQHTGRPEWKRGYIRSWFWKRKHSIRMAFDIPVFFLWGVQLYTYVALWLGNGYLVEPAYILRIQLTTMIGTLLLRH